MVLRQIWGTFNKRILDSIPVDSHSHPKHTRTIVSVTPYIYGCLPLYIATMATHKHFASIYRLYMLRHIYTCGVAIHLRKNQTKKEGAQRPLAKGKSVKEPEGYFVLARRKPLLKLR